MRLNRRHMTRQLRSSVATKLNPAKLIDAPQTLFRGKNTIFWALKGPCNRLDKYCDLAAIVHWDILCLDLSEIFNTPLYLLHIMQSLYLHKRNSVQTILPL